MLLKNHATLSQAEQSGRKNKARSIKELKQIPGVGVSIANDLWNIGIKSISELRNKDPEVIYNMSNAYAGVVQDRCLLYVFKCAVYYSRTEKSHQDPELLKWWNWKNK